MTLNHDSQLLNYHGQRVKEDYICSSGQRNHIVPSQITGNVIKKACYFSNPLFHMNVNEPGVNSFPSSHISRLRGTPVSLENVQRGKPLGFSDTFQDFVFPSMFSLTRVILLAQLVIFSQAVTEKVLWLN